ncbi:MAG: SDR family oxidoreductase [Promethearchaeota archaeon]
MENKNWIKDKICAITGANSGIGKQTALELNQMGAKVVMLCRNEQRAKKAMKDIVSKTGNSDIELIIMDLESQDSIRNAVDEFKKKYDKLHVLINNAGFINFKKQYTAEGYERTWAINHLGHFILTNLLLDVIKTSSPARIITLTSFGHKMTDKKPLEDMMYKKKKYKHIKAYGNSKLMNLFFTFELARRLEGTGITVNAVHPGPIRSKFGRSRNNPWWYRIGYSFLMPFLKSVKKGAATSVYLATSTEGAEITGKYWTKCKIRKSSKLSLDESLWTKLWEISEDLSGVKYPL